MEETGPCAAGAGTVSAGTSLLHSSVVQMLLLQVCKRALTPEALTWVLM